MVIKRRRNVRTRGELPTEADRPEPKTDELEPADVNPATLGDLRTIVGLDMRRLSDAHAMLGLRDEEREIRNEVARTIRDGVRSALDRYNAGGALPTQTERGDGALGQIIALMTEDDPCPRCGGLGAVPVEMPIAGRWFGQPCGDPNCVAGQVHRLVHGLKRQALQRAGIDRDGTRRG